VEKLFSKILPVLAFACASLSNIANAQECLYRNYNKDGAHFLDLAPDIKLRFKGNEVALRLFGAFETNESLYETLATGEAVVLTGSIKSGKTPYTTEETSIAALNSPKGLIWSVVHTGFSNKTTTQKFVSGRAMAPESVKCEKIELSPNTKALTELATLLPRRKDVVVKPPRSITVIDNSVLMARFSFGK
jgi:hypothetical protein